MAAILPTVCQDRDMEKFSSRLGSVWSEGNRRQSSQNSPVTSKSESARAKRREAATWLESQTGASIPADYDCDFRAALADGVFLCKIVNILQPDAVKVIHQASGGAAIQNQKRYENIQNFIRAVQGMDMPIDGTFSYEDLTSDGEMERPKVAECVLWLKHLWQLATQQPAPRESSDVIVAAPDQDRPAPAALTSRTSGKFAGSKAGSPRTSMSGGPATQGVAQLLTHWSSVLRNNMAVAGPAATTASTGFNPTSSEFSVDSMGPIFHNVLTNLTSDYERRLCTKDQDLSRARDSFTSLQSQMTEVQKQLDAVRSQLQLQQHSQQHNAAHQAAIGEMQAVIDSLRAELAESQRRCTELQWRLDNSDQANHQQIEALQQEITALLGRLTQFENIEQRFKATRDENRKLFNQVQDLKGAIRVYCRIRPAALTGELSAPCTEVGEDGELAIHDPSGQQACKIFRFDKIFDGNSNQAEVYEDTQPLIRSVLDGYNVCIFAYGQTGSGKTHTMSGTNIENPEGRGINYRALEDLFDMVEERKEETQYTIKVQMLEIYNEALKDLFRVGGPQQAAKLELLNTQASGCNVRNAEQVEVASSSMVMELMARGARNRHVAETNMNERSSRSHQVLTIIVDGVSRITGAATHACLNLIDLAGSERLKSSKAEGDRKVETCAINSSLSALGDVMAALARRDNHIPFRNSKLTQLLADSLAGQAKCMMFMHVSPEGGFASETVSTLNFGSKVSTITLGQAKRQVDNSKFFANEEMIRSRKEVQEKDEQLLNLHRKWQEESKQREHLQKEVDRLKNQLDIARRSGVAEPVAMSVDSVRSISRTAHLDPTTTAASTTPNAKHQVKLMGIPSMIPSATPPMTSTPTGRYASEATPQSARGTPTGMVFRPPTAPSGFRPSNGSQTARGVEPAQASRLPSATARQGSTFGGVAPRASSFTTAGGSANGSMSMRSSGMYGMSSSGLPTGPGSAAAPRLSFSALPRPAATAVPASAGGRRASMGQWKS